MIKKYGNFDSTDRGTEHRNMEYYVFILIDYTDDKIIR